MPAASTKPPSRDTIAGIAARAVDQGKRESPIASPRLTAPKKASNIVFELRRIFAGLARF